MSDEPKFHFHRSEGALDQSTLKCYVDHERIMEMQNRKVAALRSTNDKVLETRGVGRMKRCENCGELGELLTDCPCGDHAPRLLLGKCCFNAVAKNCGLPIRWGQLAGPWR